MTRRTRRNWTAAERTELWQRWRREESMSQIARAFDRLPGSIRGFFLQYGGFEPAARSRRQGALGIEEREEISRQLEAGSSMRRIATRLGRSASTISREVARNGGRGVYRATAADQRAQDAARRPKPCKLALNPRLRRIVASKLSKDWSPGQISGWLRRQFHESTRIHVSHETIYRTLFIQARGVLKKELMAYLRSSRTMRRSQHASLRGKKRGQIRDAVSISERPAEIEDRAVPGHWECDLITGSGRTYVATLVERSSRFTILVRVSSKDTATVTSALRKQIVKLPAHLRRSLTWGRGLEMAEHAAFTVATGVQVYFCDPQSPWQRGTNENTNRLLRQYLPKNERVDGYSQVQLNAIARRLNERPRKTLNFATPAETLNGALTG